MKNSLFGVIAAAAISVAGMSVAQEMKPFGTDESADYAAQLWEAMSGAKLVGDGMIRTFPYEGLAPHGLMLETFYTEATIGGHTGALIVKRNYGPEGVSEDEVLMDHGKHLGAITVMFKRESGYDTVNKDWFWAK